MENDNDESLELLFHKNIVATRARLEALETFTTAILSTLGKTFPPLLPVLQQNLADLALAREDDLPKEMLEHYRRGIADADRTVEALK